MKRNDHAGEEKGEKEDAVQKTKKTPLATALTTCNTTKKKKKKKCGNSQRKRK